MPLLLTAGANDTRVPPSQSKKFAEVQRKIAADLKVPLIDYQAEILKRRPDDWDGSLPKFKEFCHESF